MPPSSNPAPPSGTLEPQLFEQLACPACHGPLQPGGASLQCTVCGRVYPIIEGIPVLIPERATLPPAR